MWLRGFSVNAQLVSSMKFHQQFVFLSLCYVLFTVREADSTFVPGRCLCPRTQMGVRGKLKELTVLPKSPSCHNVTVIVTMRRNDQPVCLNPEGRMGRQLIRCWNRVHELSRDVKLCLRRRKGRGGGERQRLRQRRRSHSRKQSPSDAQ
ncbi:C-X-C motif chemokine 10-like [Salarias fasciatus]|uniref:C-X-C motif chemokine 10-like n=1 Tax=Salarias fasciatus TaxID=181472 RepID=A0A672FKU0_SALFA|nr:C-X-C motif chemokine 10-like [Salarias fasciatus]